MGSISSTSRGQVSSDRLGSIRDIEVVESTVEELESSNGLVERYFVASFIDTGEAEVAVLADLTILNAVNDQGLVASSSKFSAVGVVEG